MNSRISPLRSSTLALVGAAVLLTGCQSFKLRRNSAPPPNTFATAFTPQTVSDLPPLDPTLLQPPSTEYKLGPGDVVEIELAGDPASRARTVVGPDGKVYFHMVPGVDVWGKTIAQARESLITGMQQFVRERQPISVSLVAAESQRIWVLGRLNKPGIYPMAGPMTLIEALSVAGGPAPASAFATRAGTMSMARASSATDEAADLGRAFVIRQGRPLRVDFERLLREGDMSQNIYLQPDDFVYLPSANVGSVHVLGAVNQPRAVEFTNRLTLLQAVAHAGGTLVREAYPSHVAVVRGSLSEPKVAIVDMTAIVKGTASDVLLEPQDIVYVPHSPYRVLTRYLDVILTTFVRVVGVNEGARAVSDRAAPTGVTVPLSPL